MILPSAAIFYTCKCIFGGGMHHDCIGAFYVKKGGIQALAGLALSSQTVGSLLQTPCRVKPTKNLAKSDFTSM